MSDETIEGFLYAEVREATANMDRYKQIPNGRDWHYWSGRKDQAEATMRKMREVKA